MEQIIIMVLCSCSVILCLKRVQKQKGKSDIDTKFHLASISYFSTISCGELWHMTITLYMQIPQTKPYN